MRSPSHWPLRGFFVPGSIRLPQPALEVDSPTAAPRRHSAMFTPIEAHAPETVEDLDLRPRGRLSPSPVLWRNHLFLPNPSRSLQRWPGAGAAPL